jgi:hypothetical protein
MILKIYKKILSWGSLHPSIRSRGLWALMGRRFFSFSLELPKPTKKIVNAIKFENF